MPTFRTLDDADVSGKRVLLRVDLNVPMADGQVTDTTRIDRVVPTITELARKGAKVILLAHFGRPKGKVVPDLTLEPVALVTSEILSTSISFGKDCIGTAAKTTIDGLKDGDIAMLENTRFHAGEESNGSDFAKALAANGDIFVNDAFSVSHRAHATSEGLAHLLPAFAGRSMEKELKALDAALGNPQRPVLAVVGGAKVSTKLDLLENLVSKVDMLVIGGGMANTFLAAQGKPVGKSLCEHDLGDTAQKILVEANKQGCEVILPIDVVVADEFKPGAAASRVGIDDVSDEQMILDIGTDTLALIAMRLEKTKTVVWNGPLGAFEIQPFNTGTFVAARQVAMLSSAGRMTSVAGGGDTLAALNLAGAADDFTYISTAGGAFLEWLEGKDLPGVKALS